VSEEPPKRLRRTYRAPSQNCLERREDICAQRRPRERSSSAIASGNWSSLAPLAGRSGGASLGSR